jgi:hypothetical protein
MMQMFQTKGLAGVLLLFPLVCDATSMVACQSDSLFNYMNLVGGCNAGNALLSNFTYSVTGNGANMAPTASQITVAPSSSGPLFAQLDFTSSPLWSLIGPAGGQGNNSYNAFLSFTVTAPATWGIVNVGLTATGLDQGGSAGKVIESLSNGTQLQVSGFPSTLTTLSDSGIEFVPISSVNVVKKIQLSNGQGQGNEWFVSEKCSWS